MNKDSKLITYYNTKNKLDTEPALRTGVNVGGVAGILFIIGYLWPDLISPQLATIISVIAAFALPIITAIFTRGKVWSIASVGELLSESIEKAEEETRNRARKSYKVTPPSKAPKENPKVD